MSCGREFKASTAELKPGNQRVGRQSKFFIRYELKTKSRQGKLDKNIKYLEERL